MRIQTGDRRRRGVHCDPLTAGHRGGGGIRGQGDQSPIIRTRTAGLVFVLKRRMQTPVHPVTPCSQLLHIASLIRQFGRDNAAYNASARQGAPGPAPHASTTTQSHHQQQQQQRQQVSPDSSRHGRAQAAGSSSSRGACSSSGRSSSDGGAGPPLAVAALLSGPPQAALSGPRGPAIPAPHHLTRIWGLLAAFFANHSRLLRRSAARFANRPPGGGTGGGGTDGGGTGGRTASGTGGGTGVQQHELLELAAELRGVLMELSRGRAFEGARELGRNWAAGAWACYYACIEWQEVVGSLGRDGRIVVREDVEELERYGELLQFLDAKITMQHPDLTIELIDM